MKPRGTKYIKKLIPDIFLVIFFLVILLNSSYGATKGKIIVVFRYDDYCANLPLEEYIIKIFNEFNKPITFGVIPARGPLNIMEINALKNTDKKKEVEIALHGYAHTHTELFTSYDNQFAILSKGKKFLEKAFGTPVRTFIPPYNEYSLATLKVIKKLNFKTISSDEKHGPLDNSKLIYLPESCNLASLKGNIQELRRKKTGGVIVVMFHHFDFIEDNKVRGNITKEGLENLVSWVSHQSDVNVKSLDEASNLILNKKYIDYKLLSQLQRTSSFLPFDQHIFAPSYLPTMSDFKNIRGELWISLVLCYLLELIAFTWIFYLGILKYPRLKLNTILTVMLFPFMAIAFIMPTRFIGTIGMIVLSILLSKLFAKKKGQNVNIGSPPNKDIVLQDASNI